MQNNLFIPNCIELKLYTIELKKIMKIFIIKNYNFWPIPKKIK